MLIKAALIMALWLFSTALNILLIGYLDEKKLSFPELLEKETFTLISICVFAPVISMILMLGAAAKLGTGIANSVFGIGARNCSICSQRCGNECLFFKLTLKPKMMCKGRFFI